MPPPAGWTIVTGEEGQEYWRKTSTGQWYDPNTGNIQKDPDKEWEPDNNRRATPDDFRDGGGGGGGTGGEFKPGAAPPGMIWVDDPFYDPITGAFRGTRKKLVSDPSYQRPSTSRPPQEREKPTVPPKPDDVPGYIWTPQYNAFGEQTGWKTIAAKGTETPGVEPPKPDDVPGYIWTPQYDTSGAIRGWQAIADKTYRQAPDPVNTPTKPKDVPGYIWTPQYDTRGNTTGWSPIADPAYDKPLSDRDRAALTGEVDGQPTLAKLQYLSDDAYRKAQIAWQQGNSEEAKRQFDIAEGFKQRIETAKLQFDIERDPASFMSKLFAISGQEAPDETQQDLGRALKPYDPTVQPRTPDIAQPSAPPAGGPPAPPTTQGRPWWENFDNRDLMGMTDAKLSSLPPDILGKLPNEFFLKRPALMAFLTPDRIKGEGIWAPSATQAPTGFAQDIIDKYGKGAPVPKIANTGGPTTMAPGLGPTRTPQTVATRPGTLDYSTVAGDGGQAIQPQPTAADSFVPDIARPAATIQAPQQSVTIKGDTFTGRPGTRWITSPDGNRGTSIPLDMSPEEEALFREGWLQATNPIGDRMRHTGIVNGRGDPGPGAAQIREAWGKYLERTGQSTSSAPSIARPAATIQGGGQWEPIGGTDRPGDPYTPPPPTQPRVLPGDTGPYSGPTDYLAKARAEEIRRANERAVAAGPVLTGRGPRHTEVRDGIAYNLASNARLGPEPAPAAVSPTLDRPDLQPDIAQPTGPLPVAESDDPRFRAMRPSRFAVL